MTFGDELRAGEPLLQAIALTDATVSGAANTALTGIITNDLNAALPRAQHSLEVAVVGLISIATTAVTHPGMLLQAISSARTDLFGALQQEPGTTPPAVHTAFEAAAVRVIEVASALTFQAPERLLLGVTQAADALFVTVGATGHLGAGLRSLGASVVTTVSQSVALIRNALTEPIPISSAAATPSTRAENAIEPRELAATNVSRTGAHHSPPTDADARFSTAKTARGPLAKSPVGNPSAATITKPAHPVRTRATAVRSSDFRSFVTKVTTAHDTGTKQGRSARLRPPHPPAVARTRA